MCDKSEEDKIKLLLVDDEKSFVEVLSKRLTKRGIEVTVYEEHTVIGKPNHCAGILSVEGLARLDIKPSPDFIQHEVRGGVVYSPDGTPIRITGSRTRAYIVDRAAFDQLFEL